MTNSIDEKVIANDRVRKALYVRDNAQNDFFGGWNESDLELLKRYRCTNDVLPQRGEILDWLGIKTDARMHAWLPIPPSGYLTVASLPVPDDQVHAETIEYIALLVGLERALLHERKVFTAFELGASYAPWAVAAGVLAQRKNFSQINLVAVEANKEMVQKIIEHANRNKIQNCETIKLQAIHGAIYINDEDVYFPKVDVSIDNGGQVKARNDNRDYRGLELEHEVVSGYSLATLSDNYERIDFLHMDVQGAEERLLNNDLFLDVLSNRVSTFFLATQSRLIEGIALQKLSNLGWRIVRERPTMYLQNDRTQDVNGWTLRDGGQLWINPRFGNEIIIES